MVVALIEKAIDPYKANSGLELFFEISDLINLREENAKEAFKTIRKELGVYKGKNWSVCLKILSLLEVCSNNCNKRFQINLANKEFLSELKFIIGPKLNPPIEVQEKVLYLIQHWATTFKNDSDFKPIEHAYSELRSKGVDFPVYNPEQSVTNLTNTLLKNTTPPRTTADAGSASAAATAAGLGATGGGIPSLQHQQQQQHLRQTPRGVLDQPPPIGVVKLNEEQIAKLNSELDVVESNVHILNEILNELQLANKSKADDDDLSLLQDLYKTCKEMQKRITQLIGSISNENIISELLRINDDLNNSFLRYERFERSIQKGQQPQQTTTTTTSTTSPSSEKPKAADFASAAAVLQTATTTPQQQQQKQQQPVEKSLIDFGDDVEFDPLKSNKSSSASASSDINSKSANPNQTSLFAKPPPKTEKSDSVDDPNFEKQMLAEESEIKEMEEWLKRQGLGENLKPTDDSSHN